MIDLAKNKGGKCLSSEFIRSDTNMKWICEKGHFWEATPSNVKRGNWCKKCYYNSRKKDLCE